MHKHKKATLKRIQRASISIAATLIVAGTTFVAQANQTEAVDEGWGEWKALGSTYVARRRQPPKLNLPKTQRRQANVQVRLHKLLKRKQELLISLDSIETRGNSSPKSVSKKKRQRQLKKLERQIAKLEARERSLVVNGAKSGNAASSLWFHTGEEGLYSISLTELAAKSGRAENKLRKKARQGKLNLTTAGRPDSEIAQQAVSWHYDEVADSLLFAAQTYDTFYSDENAYKFKSGGKKAAPMVVVEGDATSSFGSEMPFNDTLKFEEEPDLQFATWAVVAEADADADYWYWDILYGGYIPEVNVDLSIPDPAFTGLAQIRITLRGWSDLKAGNDHEVRAEINGVAVGSSVIWDAFDEAILVADFDQSLLNASGSNTLTLRNNFEAGGIVTGEWLDQVEIDYLRKPVAVNDTLWMHEVAAGAQTVTGFSGNDIVVVESPGESATLRRDVKIEPDGALWKVTFDTIGGNDFLITERNASAIVSVTTGARMNLRKRANNAEYLIIAPRDFAETAEALAAYRSNRYGFVKIAWLDDIYNEFSAGRSDPAALGRFMQRVYSKWNTAPTMVTLIGKGSLDQKDRMEYSDSFLPVVLTSTPWGLAASDSKLLGFEDDAPFSIGRLPITNDNEGLAYMAKLTDYESTVPGDERYEAVLAADNPDDAGDFHANTDALATRLLDDLGFDMVMTLLHPESDVRASLIDSSTWGAGYISYDGHGSTAQIGNSLENYLTVDDASLLANTRYPVFTALTCAVGDDTLPGTRSLVSALVLNPHGGAIASVAPTGLSLDSDAQLLGNALVDELFASSETVGGALQSAKLNTSGSISAFMPRMYSVIGEPGVYAR